ncbi:S4 domain-containing protein [Sandaracinobacteroides hominis]|uniref:S4 domain-containing protein n=1 Tax=Sandaracinobacteroides hominis TaxID=2780086 RepID=UPI001F2B4E01|nr:S4 domain-containing protein [Sandaracinobacteroides hominis]
MVYEQGMRIDKWLWFSRLLGSRSEAQKLCESRRLRLDGRVIDRSCATVRRGAVLSFCRGDQVIAVRVNGLAERRGPYSEACLLYTHLLNGAEAEASAVQRELQPA